VSVPFAFSALLTHTPGLGPERPTPRLLLTCSCRAGSRFGASRALWARGGLRLCDRDAVRPRRPRCRVTAQRARHRVRVARASGHRLRRAAGSRGRCAGRGERRPRPRGAGPGHSPPPGRGVSRPLAYCRPVARVHPDRPAARARSCSLLRSDVLFFNWAPRKIRADRHVFPARSLSRPSSNAPSRPSPTRCAGPRRPRRRFRRPGVLGHGIDEVLRSFARQPHRPSSALHQIPAVRNHRAVGFRARPPFFHLHSPGIPLAEARARR